MAKEKKSFVLRMNCETMSALEKWAADEFRSVNGQLEYIITDAGLYNLDTGNSQTLGERFLEQFVYLFATVAQSYVHILVLEIVIGISTCKITYGSLALNIHKTCIVVYFE